MTKAHVFTSVLSSEDRQYIGELFEERERLKVAVHYAYHKLAELPVG